MRAYLTICLAANRDPTTSPSAVVEAKRLLAETADGVQIHEGLQYPGVGLSLQGDADTIVIAGALDQQCDDEYRLFLEAVFSPGLPAATKDDDDNITVNPQLVLYDSACKRCPMLCQ